MILILPCVVCAGIILKDLYGKGSYLPGERSELVCDHSNVSDAGNVVFFRNGLELQSDADYHIFSCTSSSACQTTTLLILEFANHLSGNYTCNVTSGSQVFTSNTLPVANARKLFSALPSSPLSFQLIFIIWCALCIIIFANADYSIEITEDSALQLGGDIQLSCLLNSERADVEYRWILPDGLSIV